MDEESRKAYDAAMRYARRGGRLAELARRPMGAGVRQTTPPKPALSPQDDTLPEHRDEHGRLLNQPFINPGRPQR